MINKICYHALKGWYSLYKHLGFMTLENISVTNIKVEIPAEDISGRLFHTTCPVCNSNDANLYVQRSKVIWVKCECGLIYKKWSAEARNVSQPFDPAASMYSKRLRRRVAKSRYQIRNVLNFVDSGPLLDIGCSFGYTIHAAKQLGLEARGLEYNAEVADYCRSKGYETDNGTMTALPYKSDKFQIVIMKHVLEHTHYPQMALLEVRRVLKSGGGLFIAVPDGRYWKSVRNPYKSRFFNYSCPDTGHCIYYTPDTLTRLLTDNGFRVVSVHPQLIHKTAPIMLIIAQIIAWPLHWLLEKLRDIAHLKKEFWLVAVKQ